MLAQDLSLYLQNRRLTFQRLLVTDNDHSTKLHYLFHHLTATLPRILLSSQNRTYYYTFLSFFSDSPSAFIKNPHHLNTILTTKSWNAHRLMEKWLQPLVVLVQQMDTIPQELHNLLDLRILDSKSNRNVPSNSPNKTYNRVSIAA